MLAWQPVFADVSGAGDLGSTTGPWIASSRQRADAPPTFGEYVTLWRRQGNGSWKAELDAGIAHGADAVGPGEIRTAPAPWWRQSAAGSAAALRSLMAADSAFAESASREGLATAFRKRAAPHVRLLRNGRFPLLADSASSFMRATSGYTWKPVDGGVARSGDLGYTYGVYALLTVAGGTRATESGDYLRIWRRDADGEWRIALDLTSPAE
jgi:ketosteroid isomerase-like protein